MMARVRWRGPGIFHEITGGPISPRIKEIYPGEIAELTRDRAETFISLGTATFDLRDRVEIPRDPEFPPPSKTEREARGRTLQKRFDATFAIVLERRLHPNRGSVDELTPVPIEEEA